MVTRGCLRVSKRELDPAESTEWHPVLKGGSDQKLKAGETVPVDIELYPSSTFFAAGETLQLIVSSNEITPSVTTYVRLAVDELFTNMARLQPSSTDEMSISLDKEEGRIIVRMSYHGVEPFDITRLPDPDLDAPLERRDEGGLGVYLCKRVMDDVRYEYENQNGISTITLVRNLER